MLDLIKRLRRQYRYISAQDEPVWRSVLFILRWYGIKLKWIYRVMFATSSGAELLDASPVPPSVLCTEIAQAIGVGEKELWKYHQEFENDSRFHQSILGKLQSTSERLHKIPQYGWREFLYIVVRAIKPNIMIETGSFDGLSTAVILLGMAVNNKGTLFSIDLPNPRLPVDIHAEPAWIVPDYLRDRLQLRKGTSRVHLNQVIEQVGQIDMFYHDSWHTYNNMMFEYQTAWSALHPGGFLMSECLASLNNAFKHFTKDKVNKPVIVANSQFILRKIVEVTK